METSERKPWLDAGDDNLHTLFGNRTGLEELRNSIDRVLLEDELSALIGDGTLGIENVELDETPASKSSEKTKGERVISIIVATIFYALCLAAIFGLYHFLKLLLEFL